ARARSVPYIEEARRREKAQILLELPATILKLLENRRKGETGLTAKEISDELRGTGLSVQNIDVIRVLSKLTEENKVTRVLGSDREIRYSRKEEERPR
ncbi:hypothetical protein MUP00_06770, partial [Candidatus Bathyarchaeota archaeon]|nr:hypothetical protein [Candidatus Bathyarchaeota archaeon]